MGELSTAMADETCTENAVRTWRIGMKRKSWIPLLAMAWVCLPLADEGRCRGEQPGRSTTQATKAFVARFIAANKKGYIARPCGFDMNRNGVIGEGPDGLVADGKTADPDGDGIDEDILYVDSKSGNDQTGDGSPGRPYRTVQKALNAADGPDDGAEDIICISGVFSEELTLVKGGVAGHYIRDGFQFPRNPTMIVGWDKDGDGQYPPYDKDDTAVLDGKRVKNTAISNGRRGVSCVEIAHLTIRDYGLGMEGRRGQSGAIRVTGPGKPRTTHFYVHDVEIRGVHKGKQDASARIIMSFWSGRTTLTHVAFINNLVYEFGSYFARGAPSNGSGQFRFQNNTMIMYGNAAKKGWATGWKLWGEHSGVEILDNVIDANPAAWKPVRSTIAVLPCQAARNWTIRGNVIIDQKTGIRAQPFPGRIMQWRSMKGIVIDRNIIVNTYEGWNSPPVGIVIQGGKYKTSIVEDITITNNFISCRGGTAIMSTAANDEGPHAGSTVIAGNTMYCDRGKSGISIVRKRGRSKYPQNDFIIRNNIIASPGTLATNILAHYAPTGLIAEGNVYDGAAGFTWDRKDLASLEEWKEATGQDAKSVARKPTFTDPGGGDLHLSPKDARLKGVGVDITKITKVDFDGDPRSATRPVAGADVSPSRPTSRPR